MKVVAVVPMKLNNERLPNKNTKRFDNGDELCKYILKTLKDVSEIDRIYVYCSNPKIQDFLPEGIDFIQRSSTLDTSETSMNEVLKCFSDEIESDIYVMSHVTSPFVKSSSIATGLSKVISGEFDSAFAVQDLKDFMWKDNKPFNYSLDKIARTQDLPEILAETSGFYIYTKEIISKYNRRIGFNPYQHKVSKIEAIDIDDEDDFFIANAIFNQL